MPRPRLVTRLHIPPLRRNLVRRPRLIERLKAGLPGQSDDLMYLVNAAHQIREGRR